ncbi:MAG: YdcF family protein [Anaerolineae bacterium]
MPGQERALGARLARVGDRAPDTLFQHCVQRPAHETSGVALPGAVGPEQLAQIDWEAVRTIVVFSGCTVAFDGEPITRQVDGPFLARLVEGVRLYDICPDCTLILSGGYGCDADAPVETLTNWRFATEYGVAPEDLVIERTSLDTDDQARVLAGMLSDGIGQAPFLVVTSASHMPRTMALFEAEGLVHAIPAPTDYATGLYSLLSKETFSPESLYPNAKALWNTERAIYEYLGLLLIWVRSLL